MVTVAYGVGRRGLCFAMAWRQYLVFGVGVLLGVGAGAGMLVAAKNWQAAEAQRAARAEPVAAAPQASACQDPPLLAAAGAADGQFGAPPETVDKTRYDVTAYLAVGDDAAQQGRVRDAEVAFLTACRIAGYVAEDDPSVLGDAAYRLGRHYLAVAAADPTGIPREQQLGRAEALFRLGMQAHAMRLGQSHQKTRLAAAGMTLAQQAAALSGPMQAAAAAQLPASSPVAVALAAPPAPALPTATLGGPTLLDPSAPVRSRPRAPRPAAEPDAPGEDTVGSAPPVARAGARPGREPARPQREEAFVAEVPALESAQATPAPLPYGPEMESP
jgi:hypothetical protein